MAEEALRKAQVEREEIECVAVGIGPGSYTGIRGAIALAQGWQLGRGVGLLGISSAECVAAQGHAEGLLGRVDVVIDAQRLEFYLAGYDLSPGGWRETEPLRLATLAEVRERQRAGGRLIGPEANRWFPGGRVIFPQAATLGRLALGRSDFVAGEEMQPIYLRQTKFVKHSR
jgi:tRNA threonylcarbamoyl adenosine modification protein YeaZ